MDEEILFIIDAMEESMKGSIDHLNRELVKVRAGRANPVMLDGVRVDYYGSSTPIKQLASITAPDARMLQVTPFDKSALRMIEKAIIEANLGFNPQNDGILIRINIPLLTEERRRGLVKQAKNEAETAKISLRNERRDAMSELKKLKDDGVSEDMIKQGEEKVNEVTKKYSDWVDSILKRKEDEIMTI